MAPIVVSLALESPPDDIWTQLKQENRDFALRQVKNQSWDFAVDLARFSFGNMENTSANDLILQQALQKFTATSMDIKDQLLEAYNVNAKQYGQAILEDLNRHLNVVHSRLQDLTRESASLNPAAKETLASVNASASALTALISSMRLPSTKGEIAEINVVHNLRSAFLGIPSVSIEQAGGAGETDAIIHFNVDELEIAKVLIECKNQTAWSNSFIAQLERDMSQQRAEFGILVTAALPKDAKSRGFTISEGTGIIIITTADLTPAIALILYELVVSLDRLTAKAQTLHALLRSRELIECVTNNLSLVQPLQNIIKIIAKAHADITATANSIIDAIQRNNAKLAEYFQQNGVNSQ